MFPNVSFLGIDLYWLMIIIGVVAAIVLFRILYGRAGISYEIFRFSVIVLAASIILGYVFAVLFQSWYNYLETGRFVWGAGATFYGGLIGAVAVFLSAYFGVGRFLFKDNRHIAELDRVVATLLPCTAAAHGFGRIGCLFDGCCYGKVTKSWIGVPMWVDGLWENRIPVQLFEALFLFALFAVMAALLVKRKFFYTPSVYLIAYGVWRFGIEYARDDSRGSSGIPSLTPSQLTAIILVIVGIALVFLYKYLLKGKFEKLYDKISAAKKDKTAQAEINAAAMTEPAVKDSDKADK